MTKPLSPKRWANEISAILNAAYKEDRFPEKEKQLDQYGEEVKKDWLFELILVALILPFVRFWAGVPSCFRQDT